MTLRTLITARVSLTSNGWPPSRTSVRLMVLPGLPRILAMASIIDRPLVGCPSILTIRSPASMPALDAGVSSIGDTTLMKPSSMPTSMPSPPNSPLVLSCSSAKASGSR